MNVTDTVLLLHSLGFVVHPRKSSLIPSQEIVILGFIINSVAMTVRLIQDKLASLISSCNNLLRCLSPTIREVARVVGKLVFSLPGVRYGPLYYRHLERDKCLALKIQKGNFDQHMSLSTEAKSELHWWVNNVQNAYNPILLLQPQHTITTDVSRSGWGAVYGEVSSGGNWTPEESNLESHINYLEMLAICLGLQIFAKDKQHTHKNYV